MKRGRPLKYGDLYDEVEAMLVGDCLRWRDTARPHTVIARLSNHFAKRKIIRTICHAGELFIVRVG